MDVQALSVRKGALLDCPKTAEQAERYRRTLALGRWRDDFVYHREDPRWLEQWLAVSGEVSRRRREHTTPIWCVIANIMREAPHGPGGLANKVGTKHFKGGAKVYCVDAYWGAYEHVIVIGRWRGAGRLVRAVVPARRMENFRAKLAYDPGVIDGYPMHWGGGGWTEDGARRAERAFETWKADYEQHRRRAQVGKLQLPLPLHAQLGNACGKVLHWVDIQLADGRFLARVPMQHTWFADDVGFDPQTITAIQPTEPPPDWTEDPQRSRPPP